MGVGFDFLHEHACSGLHLNTFGPNGTWYLYTVDPKTRDPDNTFCCDATWVNKNGMRLGTINRKFIDEMKYAGEVDFHGRYYDGRARRYVMSMDTAGAELCPT